jgi:hypothetical protein
MPDLNEATERLNSALKQSEKLLAELKLGVRAEEDLGKHGAAGFTLAFGKFNNEWKLIACVHDEEMPLLNASREVRVAAAKALPRLLESLHRIHDRTARGMGPVLIDLIAFNSSLAKRIDHAG